MIPIIGLLILIALSIIVIRIGAVALELTGLSSEVASFQAQSAFSGVGFTTMESETIVSHPVRRRIIKTLILLGSAGVTTSIATLVLAFVGETKYGFVFRIQALLAGLVVILLFARSKHIYKIMRIIITKVLGRYTRLRIFDYEQLFGLGEGYAIAKVIVKRNSALDERAIKDLKAELEEMLVLAVYRKEGKKTQLIGAPHGEVVIKAGDELICYAKEEVLDKRVLQKDKR
jgi:hypothetical protein